MHLTIQGEARPSRFALCALTLLYCPRTLMAMVVASIVVADARFIPSQEIVMSVGKFAPLVEARWWGYVWDCEY